MKYLSQIIFVLLIVGSPLYAQDTSSHDEERFLEFFRGIQYLNASTQMSDSYKRMLYVKLEEVTGYNAQKASAFIQRHSHNPAQWKLLVQKIAGALNPEKKEPSQENGKK